MTSISPLPSDELAVNVKMESLSLAIFYHFVLFWLFFFIYIYLFTIAADVNVSFKGVGLLLRFCIRNGIYNPLKFL